VTFDNREAWLNAAVTSMAEWFAEVDVELPAIRVSCAWSKRPGKGIAWCWKRERSADGTNEIQVSPEKDDPAEVLAALVHEVIHATDDCASKHSGYFKTIAANLGLTGKMTATVPNDELSSRITALAHNLGPYPHAALNPNAEAKDKQTTRMIKVVCPEEGYTVRTTRKWIDVGLPLCPCGNRMEVEERDDD